MAVDAIAPRAAEVTPRCRHFGECGGCQLQHLKQTTQIQIKVERVANELKRAGIPVPPITTHSAEEYGYRNRIRLRIEDGRLGYSRRMSHSFLHVTECPIAAPLLWHGAASLQGVASAPSAWPAGSTEVELCCNADEQALQMLLHVNSTVATLERDAPERFRALCRALQERLPQLAGAGLLVQGELAVGSRRVQSRQRVEVARWGAPDLTYRVAGVEYRVSRGAFFQVNRFLTERMVELAVGGRAGRIAWDLFAGAGLFSVPLASRFDQVVAVEVGQPAAHDLAELLAAVGGAHRAVAQPVLGFLKQQQRPAPDLIVMDPPRAGLTRETTQQLARIGAAAMVYVSCDATTFAQDSRALIDSRYTITDLHLLDLFPQTDHTETIAVLRRS